MVNEIIVNLVYSTIRFPLLLNHPDAGHAPPSHTISAVRFVLILCVYLFVCSLHRHCPVMSRRVLTLPPTSTGCTAGQRAATWPRAITTGSRRARPCPTQGAGWACTRGRSTRRWPSSTSKPEKVRSRAWRGTGTTA